jgi:lipopolysaccharide transport system ATP-binding protein
MGNEDTAIDVKNLSKVYRIGLKEDIQDNLARTFVEFLKAPYKNYLKYRSLYKFDDITSRPKDNVDEKLAGIIWALRDVSFKVGKGEVIGIIGRNGAGKSTLLKILSRITEPTEGQARIRGRVSSLLEVGTGFHPELTGKENIYLNGTILGMRKFEIDHKFDEIVEFSGIEKFINTPVKRYSSGMRVRLAFAVSAHLEPEILLIDEVLAVGDAQFQKKCLNKMQDVGQQGRTVLFVSHNMPAITRLCPRAIILDQGRLIADGPSSEVVHKYLDSGTGTTASREWPDIDSAPGDRIVRLRAVRARSENGRVSEAFDIRHPIGLEMEFDVLESGHILLPYYKVFNEEGVTVFAAIDLDPNWKERPRPAGKYITTAWIPGNILTEGALYVTAAMRAPEPRIKHFVVHDGSAFRIIDSTDGDSARGNFGGYMRGVIRPLLKWETLYSELDGQPFSKTKKQDKNPPPGHPN